MTSTYPGNSAILFAQRYDCLTPLENMVHMLPALSMFASNQSGTVEPKRHVIAGNRGSAHRLNSQYFGRIMIVSNNNDLDEGEMSIEMSTRSEKRRAVRGILIRKMTLRFKRPLVGTKKG